MGYINAAPAKGRPFRPVRLDRLTMKLARYWHTSVQSHIDNPNSPANTPHVRADVGWDWRLLLLMSRALPRVRAYAYVTPNTNGLAVPIGMLLTYANYPWLADHKEKSSYIWFLAAAPDCAQTAVNVPFPLSMGRALVDAGFVESEADNNDGRIGLHADPNGGNFLLEFYEKYCGLSKLPKTHMLPLGPTGVRQAVGQLMQGLGHGALNDGRYFTGSPAEAKSFMYPWKTLR